MPALLPAYQVAERRLLSFMLQDEEVARYVGDRLGTNFNIEDHVAIAAYLYAYYAQGKTRMQAGLSPRFRMNGLSGRSSRSP
ncbi:hypothetical protein HMSSN036_46170 [Paenibacillus macerans]|nr:hypothetical protein HMSSN036_46170 [Paenibacillus macerans]